jgi:hypothetical protein
MVSARFNKDTMKKNCFFKFVIAVALSVATPAQVTAQSSAYLIRAGRSIGRIHVGVKGDFDLKRFPKPDAEDYYTSHSIKVWILKKSERTTDTLFVKTVSNSALGVEPSNGVSVQVIRVTSPRYHTLNGLSTGSTLARVRREFPNVVAVHDNRNIYDDNKQGIAFEFADSSSADSPCIAVMVHPRGEQYIASAEEVQNLLKEGHRP